MEEYKIVKPQLFEILDMFRPKVGGGVKICKDDD